MIDHVDVRTSITQALRDELRQELSLFKRHKFCNLHNLDWYALNNLLNGNTRRINNTMIKLCDILNIDINKFV